jgi:alkaline phosphatase D
MATKIARRSLLWSLSLPLLAPGCATFKSKDLVTLRHDSALPLTRIALGPCLRENWAQLIWPRILMAEPVSFIHLGDNVYGDTENASELRSKYGGLWGDSGYQALRRKLPVVAAWDDHDFGKNNAGRTFCAKTETKQVFCDFFGESLNSERRIRDGGIYNSYEYGPLGQRVQIILMDVRSTPVGQAEA